MKKVKHTIAILSILILVMLTNVARDAYVERYTYHTKYEEINISDSRDSNVGEITNQDKIVQHINIGDKEKNIGGLGILFATYNRMNESEVCITITNGDTNETIIEKTINAKDVIDNEYIKLDFQQPIKAKEIVIEVVSNALNKDQAITIYKSNQSANIKNELYINDKKVEGDLSSYILCKDMIMPYSQFVIIWLIVAVLIGGLVHILLVIIENYVKLLKNLNQYFANFKKYSPLLKELVVKEVKLKYKRSALGFVWSILNPLLMMCVMTVVFSTLFKSNIENFPVYLILGQIVFNFYSDATNGAMNAVVGGAGLISKVYIPKYIFPMAKVFSALVNLMFSLVAVLIVVLVTKVEITGAILAFPIGLVYVTIFALGIGLILSAYSVFFRDINHLYGVLLLAWTYLTPIFYPIEIIPKQILFIVKANPMYCYITYFRQIVLEGQVPNLSLNLICIGYALLALLLGLIVFYKKQDDFILYL